MLQDRIQGRACTLQALDQMNADLVCFEGRNYRNSQGRNSNRKIKQKPVTLILSADSATTINKINNVRRQRHTNAQAESIGPTEQTSGSDTSYLMHDETKIVPGATLIILPKSKHSAEQKAENRNSYYYG